MHDPLLKTHWFELEVGDLLGRKDDREDFVKFALVVSVHPDDKDPDRSVVLCIVASGDADYEFMEWRPAFDAQFHRNFNLL